MRIVFFAPFARIIQHSIPEATVARELTRLGCSVEYISCGEIYAGQCVVLDSIGMVGGKDKAADAKICEQCNRCSSKLYPSSRSLSDLIGISNRDENLQLIEHLISGVDRKNFIDFEYLGIPFGRLSAYQHMIAFKKLTSDIEESEWPIFKQELRNCLLTFFALTNWKTSQALLPDRAFVYNSYYSVNAVFRLFMENLGIPVISLHAGSNLYHFYDTMMVSYGDSISQHKRLLQNWSNFSNLPLSDREGKWVVSHFEELSRGRSVFAYSSPVTSEKANTRERWNIPPESNIVLVALSSYDERFAAEYVGILQPSKDAIYSDQIAWVKDILEFAESKKEVFFVIRLHPREFPNKRDSRRSMHAQKLLEVLSHVPPNVRVNTPDDGISLYELAKDINLLLTAWSSVAKEFLLLGIPVVVFTSDMQWFPPEFASVARNRNQYFDLINQAMSEGWSLEKSRLMFRWIAFESNRTTFKLTTSLSPASPRWKRLFWRIIQRIDYSLFIAWRIGRVSDSSQLLAFLTHPFTIPRVSSKEMEDGIYDSNETRILLTSLKKIGVCFWGPEEHWPKSFKSILSLK